MKDWRVLRKGPTVGLSVMVTLTLLLTAAVTVTVTVTVNAAQQEDAAVPPPASGAACFGYYTLPQCVYPDRSLLAIVCRTCCHL